MAFKRKIDLQGDVFDGISSVFAVKDGIPTNEQGKVTLTDSQMLEFPVSDDNGFNFDTGAPSMTHFKVKGLNADWVCTFTPGDGEIKLEIPCNETGILEACFGTIAVETEVTLPSGTTVGGKGALKGKSFGVAQKAVTFGMLILNDAEDKVLYIKKAKFMAQITFDGSKPVCVTLTGTLSAGAEKDAFGILVPADASV